MKEQFLLDKLSKMSLQTKIGQMLLIDYRNEDGFKMTVDLEKVLTTYSPGGFILFRSNLSDYKNTQKLLHSIKEIGDISPFIAADHEGGIVQKLSDVGLTRIPSMEEVAKTMSEEDVFNLGKKMGEELKSIGVDMDMAPVLDVLSNPNNVGIQSRSFGSDPEVVKRLSMAIANGLKEEKVISVGKHFPGHGGVITNSHEDLPVIDKNLEELKVLELIPFIEAIKQNVPGIMVGHLAVPKVTGDKTPASLSKVLVNDILRDDLGYNGLSLPDALKRMGALTKYFDEREIYLRCINAGNDMLLMPQNINIAYDTIYRAVNEGTITEERINEAVYRILSTKFDYGFFDKEYNEYVLNNQNQQYVNTQYKHR